MDGESTIYSVDEAGDLLQIPRPTVYRYLKECSIPHERRAGKISIPEESLELIRRARELHEEGLETDHVRSRLRGGSDVDPALLAERLDRLSETLESIQVVQVGLGQGQHPNQTLQVILARQSLLISAVINLTSMVEDLLAATGHPRKPASDDLQQLYRQDAALRGTDLPLESVNNDPPMDMPEVLSMPEVLPTDDTSEILPEPTPRGRFGTLARRRRLGAMISLFVLVILSTLLWGALAFSSAS